MAGSKRKRESLAAPAGDANGEGNAVAMTGESTPFTIDLLKDKDALPKKRRMSGKNKGGATDWSEGKEESGFEAGDEPTYYAVLPGEKWNSMKKYKNFIVSDQTFGVHDFVYVNSGGNVAGSKAHWVAKVLEVRADGPSNVYLRVFWMYWPEELPMGRQSYHGNNEVIASNFMEVIDAMSVSDHAHVTHIVEDEWNAPPADGVYWRQTFDMQKSKLGTLKALCKCEGYNNPDKLLIQCENEECGRWLHEGCLVEDALQREWDNITKERAASNDTSNAEAKTEISDAIQVTATPTSAAKANGVAPSTGKKKGRGKKGRRESTYKDAKPWEGVLEGKLDREGDSSDTDAKSEKTTEEEKKFEPVVATGKVTITDQRGPSPVTSQVSAECLFCRRPIT